MKKIILSILSLVVVLLLLSGCFILGPTIKVSGLVSDFEKYWEAENSVELAGLYTNPAIINTATKSYSQIIDAYSSRFEGRNVIHFDRTSNVDVDFNEGVTEAGVEFSVEIKWNSGPIDYRTYIWRIKNESGKWLISRSNEY
ncbi:MAG: Uncharacterized protein XD94_0259 [Mesotoga prima]|uniref:DUF4440 domain-containing protein n=1 Tax=Mesotoga prima TaxID=1184387 RepID=A0A101HRX5_9BACT|nr:MAG: Uncharacterized protein XD94_0259 [Mesotoga prima]